MKYLHTLLLLLTCVWLNAHADTAQPLHADQVTEARAQQLFAEFRCLVCQNQTLADSHAGLAEDLKTEIRKMIQQGMSDAEVTDYLVTRYGDFVRYRPAFQANTLLLWLGPFILLLITSITVWRFIHKQQPKQITLSESEQEKLQQLIQGDD